MRKCGGGGGGRKGKTAPTITDVWQIFCSYTDSNGNTWYGERHVLLSILLHLLIPHSHMLATLLLVMLTLNCQPMQLLLEMIYDGQNCLV